MKIPPTLLLACLTSLSLCASEIPRPEYPRPQFEREQWINLNGAWTYTFDVNQTGTEKGYVQSEGFEDTIVVPFPPESELSGVGHTDFIDCMWYHRIVSIPSEWDGKKVHLHFGAVDFESTVYIDGEPVGEHWGGSSSFKWDITDFVQAGSSHNLVVHVIDNTRSKAQTTGKQSQRLESHGCFYTRTTGIWQTVWLEATEQSYIERVQIIPDLDAESFVLIPEFKDLTANMIFRVTLLEDHESDETTLETIDVPATSGLPVTLPISDAKSWSPEDPHLYGLVFELIKNGKSVDKVKSYAGLRKVHVAGNRLYLNNKPIYLRHALDQGFYPEGIWTAPSEFAFKRDIELAKKAGFNGVRLHEKVFEERYHYWADKLGFLTWGESATVGSSVGYENFARNFLSEWAEVIVRDRNHPSIITWVPFNETHGPNHGTLKQHNRLIRDAYDLTKFLDPTRPVNDASGRYHLKTDLWSVHIYRKTPDELKSMLALDSEGMPYRNKPDYEAPYQGQPYFVDEYGGLKWTVEGKVHAESWGWSDVDTLNDFYDQLKQLTDVILSFDHISGYCYTQLYDVEQEQNGIYNYDRTEKFDMDRIYQIFSAPAAMEK